jgi:glycosyltransferase involved in cell wall biosynthesis
VAEQAPLLAGRFDLTLVTEDLAAVRPDLARRFAVEGPGRDWGADLDLYHLGNSPAHAFVYRAARRRPGVAVLHEWGLHHLVLSETVERGDPSGYLGEMRRAHGEAGTFVGRQVARGLGGHLLPSLFPLNDRVLEGSLAVVGLTRHVCARAERRMGDRPVLLLPHHLSLPLDPLPSREEARERLGLPRAAPIVTAPGLATPNKGLEPLLRAVGRLREAHPALLLVVAGALEPGVPLDGWREAAGLPPQAVTITGRLDLADLVRHLAAADVVSCLRFPTHGEISGVLVRTLGVGRPALVTAGTPACEEFPEGVVVPVDPGPSEEDALAALLGRLLRDDALRAQIGRLAAAHVQVRHALAGTVDRLAGFLELVHARKEALAAEIRSRQVRDEGLRGRLCQEALWAARDLGLPGLSPDVARLVTEWAVG